VRFEVFTAVSVTLVLFRVLTICSFVGWCQRFGETYCLLWRENVSLKRWQRPTKLYGTETQNTTNRNSMAMPWLRQSPASHRGGPGSGPGQFMWNLWLTKWHCDEYLSQVFSIFLSISFHCGSPLSYIIWGMNNRPVKGRSSESHPHRHEENSFVIYTSQVETTMECVPTQDSDGGNKKNM
jgi:hypothetical protein